MSMRGAVKYRRTFSADSCNMVQTVAIDHKKSPSVYQTSIPIHSDKGLFTEFWYDPQGLEPSHRLCDTFADVFAPVSFVMLSYLDEWALNASRKNRARKEANLRESLRSTPDALSKRSLLKSSHGLITMSLTLWWRSASSSQRTS